MKNTGTPSNMNNLTDQKLIEEVNNLSFEDRCKFLHELFNASVRIKWYDEIYHTDGSRIEVTDEQTLVLLGKLLHNMSVNNGKML